MAKSVIFYAIFLIGMICYQQWDKDDYNIRVNGRVLDIRKAPHWDLIVVAWTNENNQLLLKLQGNGNKKDPSNWLEGKQIQRSKTK